MGFLQDAERGIRHGLGNLERGVRHGLREGAEVLMGALGSPFRAADEYMTQSRQVRELAQEQVQAYKDQTEITRKELESKRQEANVQKRRIEEKQIRSLRRNYSPGGFLGGQQQATEPDMTTKLGG